MADSRTAPPPPPPPPSRVTCRLISDYAAIAAEHVRDVAWLIHATHGDQPTGRDATHALCDAAHALDRMRNIHRTWYTDRKFDIFLIVGIGLAALTKAAGQSGAAACAFGVLAGILTVTTVDRLARRRTRIRRAQLPAPTCLPDPNKPIDSVIDFAEREALAAHLLAYELAAILDDLLSAGHPHPAWERRIIDTGNALVAADYLLREARTHIAELVVSSPAT